MGHQADGRVSVVLDTPKAEWIWLASSAYIAKNGRIDGIGLSDHVRSRVSLGGHVSDLLIEHCQTTSFSERVYLEVPPPLLTPTLRASIHAASEIKVVWSRA